MRKFFTFVAATFAALALNAAPLSVADAIAEGMKLDSAATSEAEYEIQGFVINAQPFSLSYNNQIWYMADAADAAESDFQAYGCVAVEEKDTLQVINGDKVILKGKLFKYWNKSASKYIIEVKEGVASFVSKAEGDHTIKNAIPITVAKALEIGTALEPKGVTSEAYEITGYISAMAGKDGDFDNYGNQTYWIADSKESTAASNAEGAFEVYRGIASQEVFVGDKVMVKTAIKKYDDGTEAGLIESETKVPVTIIESSQPVEVADVVFNKDDFAGQGEQTSGGYVSATKDGVTFVCDKAWEDGLSSVRCYKGANIKITSEKEQIGKIVFLFGVVSGETKDGGLDAEIIVNGMEWIFENIANQARIKKIKIYFGEYEKPEEPKLPEGVITCAAAVDLAASIDDPTEPKATVEGDAVKIRGYVTFAYDTKDGKQSAWLSDKKGSKSGVLQGAYLEVTEAVAVGDYVHIEGTLAKYLKEGKDGKPNEILINVINGTMRKVKEDEIFITTYVTPANAGQVTIEDNKLTAIANYGYHFVQWNDGITDNPRFIELTKDTTFTAEFAPNMYSFSAACNEEEGEVEAENGEYPYLTTLTISATPKYGYHFAYWSDGEYSSQRTVTITRDMHLYAYFERNTYSISAAYNPQGTISGTGSFLYKTECSVRAIPNSGYHFVEWLDGVKNNPRTFILTQDTVFAALFAIDTTGTCGKDYKLSWAYNDEAKRLTISGNGSFDENMNCGVEAKQKMVELVIDEGVTAIGNEAFSNCEHLATIQLPTSVKTIGERAFYNCLDLTSIYNYRENPCLIKSSTFEEVNTFDCTLYVLKESVEKYKSEGSGWKIFYEVKPIGTTTVDEPITDVETQPNDNNVVVTWPISDDAETYTLEITKDGVVFCTLIFNAEGQLRGIAFAPSRSGGHQASAAEKTANGGLRFTVTGLESATDYQLTVKAKDAEEKEIASYTTEFTTTGIADSPQAIDQITNDQTATTNKVIRDGQLLILRGKNTYTVDGREVR